MFYSGEARTVTDDTVMRTMLFDFYGELLTEKQREYFDLHYNADLSLAEIAERTGISRQGVWDIIRRAEATRPEAEQKTGLVRRSGAQRETISAIEAKLTRLETATDGEARRLVQDIRQELQALKG